MTMQNRKPRIALMGEFSSGKSTLSNLLLGKRPLPERVTATRLSPVWMSAGTQAPYRIDMEGNEQPISIESLEGIPVEETRVIRLFFEADVLDTCDLIDFPGISDPNMSPEVWQRMLDEVDSVVWCTHATQAWRQSEAAVWETIPEEVRRRSLLLVTKFDKLTTERDRHRVLARLAKETKGLFADIFPISLKAALAAGENYEAFAASGGLAFLQRFLEMTESLAETLDDSAQTLFAMHRLPDPVQPEPAQTKPAAVVASDEKCVSDSPTTTAASVASDHLDDAVRPGRIIPRRVKPRNPGMRASRPRRPAKKSGSSGMALYGGIAPFGSAQSADLRAIFKENPVAAEE